MKLNLIYHITAVDRPLMWYNLERLRQRLPLFNGKKIITIALPGDDEATRTLLNFQSSEEREFGISQSLHIASYIQRFLGTDDRTTYNLVPNSLEAEAPHFFETAAPMVASTDPSEFTFYGHTKGIRYRQGMREYQGVALWTDALYTHALDPFADIVSKLLSGWQSYGAVKVDRGGGDFDWCGVPGIQWHYSGSFFWFSHAAVFNNPAWHQPSDTNRFRLEYFLPRLIPSDKAYSSFPLPSQFYNSGQLLSYGAWDAYLQSIGSSVPEAIDAMNDKVSDIVVKGENYV